MLSEFSTKKSHNGKQIEAAIDEVLNQVNKNTYLTKEETIKCISNLIGKKILASSHVMTDETIENLTKVGDLQIEK